MTGNPDFWERQVPAHVWEKMSLERSPWHEEPHDAEIRRAQQELFETLKPMIQTLVATRLTLRQQQVITMYFFEGHSQEVIATQLGIRQSTVSRHLFGTTRNGKKIGGAVHKLRQVVDSNKCPSGINAAVNRWQQIRNQALAEC